MSDPRRPHADVRPDWLALRTEEAVEPELPIVDPHHHLWDRPGHRYMAHDYMDDIRTGHTVVSTVFVQCRSMLRKDGPRDMAPVGEVDFANGAAALGASGLFEPTRVCEAIVGGADLALGDGVVPVLEAMISVAGTRFRGVRNPVVWHESSDVQSSTASPPPRGLMATDAFRKGVRQLARMDLSLDVWAYHTQLDEILALARENPGMPVIIDHMGGPIGVGPYARDLPGMLTEWAAGLQRLANLPNTYIKFGGAGMPVFGFGFHEATRPPSSDDLVRAWKRHYEICLNAFGPQRFMFESNFPVDNGSFSYAVLWNAFKKLSASCSPAERHDMLAATAARVYRLADPAIAAHHDRAPRPRD